MSEAIQVLLVDDRVSSQKGLEIDGIEFLTRPDLPAAIFTLNHTNPDLIILSSFSEDEEKLNLLKTQAEKLDLKLIYLAEDPDLDLKDPSPEDLLSGRLNSLIRELISSRKVQEDWSELNARSQGEVTQSLALLDKLPLAVWLMSESAEILYANEVDDHRLDPTGNPELLAQVQSLVKQGLKRAEFAWDQSGFFRISIHPFSESLNSKFKVLIEYVEEPEKPKSEIFAHRLGWEWAIVEHGLISETSSSFFKLIKSSDTERTLSKVFDSSDSFDWKKPIVGVHSIKLKSGPKIEITELPASIFNRNGRTILIRPKGVKVSTEAGLSVDDLIHLTSHDLKEPVRIILNYSQLLERIQEDPSSEQEEFLNYIKEAGGKIDAYLRQLQYLVRMGKSKAEGDCSLKDLVPSIVTDLKLRYAHVNFKIAKDLPTINADAKEAHLLFSNLLSNAANSSKNEGVVRLTVKELGDFYLFSVKDNGRGIPEEYLEKIFDITSRLENSAGPEGAGLGLTICKAIVGGNGGEIWIESEEDQGTTVHFTWPAN